jgi:hypothetical protein
MASVEGLLACSYCQFTSTSQQDTILHVATGKKSVVGLCGGIAGLLLFAWFRIRFHFIPTRIQGFMTKNF